MKDVCPDLFEAEENDNPSDQNSVKKKWKQCLDLIEKEIPWQTYQTWFVPINPITYVDDTLTLRVSSRFVSEWLESHFSKILRKIVKSIFGENSQIEYLITPSPQDKPEPINSIPSNENKSNHEKKKEPSIQFKIEPHLNPHNTLNRFIIYRKNKMCKKAAEYVSTYLDNNIYNPLFVNGEVGTGKSHILNAIGNNVSKQYSDRKIVLLSGEQFLHEYVCAIQKRKVTDFKAELTNADVFLLDDVHYFSGKVNSQESLSYILSQLYKKNKRIIITSNSPPNRLSQFDQRLISIFQNGLILDLVVPEQNAREKIIQQYLTENDIKLSDEIVEYLSEKLSFNLHHLNSVLVHIAAQVSLLGNSLNLEECRRIVNHLTPESHAVNGKLPPNFKINIEKIIRNVADYFEIPPDVITGSSRYSKIVLARQIAMYVSRKYTGESLSNIGYHFGDRNHTSVLYAFNKMKKELKKKPELKDILEKIIEKIMGSNL
jgi:chromosomal replication initiator protein